MSKESNQPRKILSTDNEQLYSPMPEYIDMFSMARIYNNSLDLMKNQETINQAIENLQKIVNFYHQKPKYNSFSTHASFHKNIEILDESTNLEYHNERQSLHFYNEANYHLGLIFLNKPNKSYYNIFSAIHHLTNAAKNNHKDAAFKLSLFHHEKDNFELSFKYMLIAADNNHKNAAFNIGLFYAQQDNSELAYKYLLIAANNGHIEAQNNIGVYYLIKKDLKDFKKAESFLLAAAANYHIPALLNLGDFYMEYAKKIDNIGNNQEQSDIMIKKSGKYLKKEQSPPTGAFIR